MNLCYANLTCLTLLGRKNEDYCGRFWEINVNAWPTREQIESKVSHLVMHRETVFLDIFQHFFNPNNPCETYVSSLNCKENNRVDYFGGIASAMLQMSL